MRCRGCLICPLSPFDKPDSAADEGWSKLEDVPIQLEPSSAQAASEEVVSGDAVEAVDEEEAQMPRGMPEPFEPKPEEIARHTLTHYPYRSWCPHCVASRKPNAHHRSTKRSAGRRIPLFCADYCFVKDSHDAEMATVLAGRIYPTCQVLATVCDAKGVQDEMAIARLTTFVKETGFAKLVYKSDQENAITAMIEAAIRHAGRTGVPEDEETFDPGLYQAVAEVSAVGSSASNG